MKPNPMPFVIEKLNGMSMITSAAGRPIARSWKSIPAILPRVREARPSSNSASSSASVSVLTIR